MSIEIGDAATWASAFAALLAVIVGYWQLSGINATLRVNGLVAILQLESDLHSRMHRLAEISTRIELEAAKAKPNSKVVLALGRNLDACTEHYLNAVDRLAFCIRNNFVPDRDWRAEYRTFIAETIKSHPKYFGPGSLYSNVLDLHDKWQRV